MDRHTASAVYTVLEAERQFEQPADDGWNPPTYDVRLDAHTDDRATAGVPRAFRIRVTPGSASGGIGEDEWRFVLDLAKQHECAVDVDNSAIVLR